MADGRGAGADRASSGTPAGLTDDLSGDGWCSRQMRPSGQCCLILTRPPCRERRSTTPLRLKPAGNWQRRKNLPSGQVASPLLSQKRPARVDPAGHPNPSGSVVYGDGTELSRSSSIVGVCLATSSGPRLSVETGASLCAIFPLTTTCFGGIAQPKQMSLCKDVSTMHNRVS